MPGIPNTKEMTCTDGSGPTGDVFNVNTSAGQVEIPNGKVIKLFSDAYTTATTQINAGGVAPAQSATAPAIANAGTINTANVGEARVSPAGPVTGIILQPGTIPGQQCTVVNEAVAANYVQFAAAGTSNVADGINEIIPGLQSRQFTWNSVQNLWYSEPATTNGTVFVAQSATAPDPGANGTITTTGVGLARANPAAARTGIILQAGVFPGQIVVVENLATSANSLTMAASGTSNVADGTSDVISGGTAGMFIWDSSASLWYRIKAS